GALGNAGSVEETHHAVGRLRALGEPGLDLVHVELQPRLIVLWQQRIEMAETLDEAAVARKARIGGDDVIDRTLLGACASKADNNWHLVLLQKLKCCSSAYFFFPGKPRPGKVGLPLGPVSPGRFGNPVCRPVGKSFGSDGMPPCGRPPGIFSASAFSCSGEGEGMPPPKPIACAMPASGPRLPEP